MSNFETLEVPKVSSRWVYNGHRVVVTSVTVNWQYENEVNNLDAKTYRGALCVFNGGRVFNGGMPIFTPAPREVKAGQTYKSLHMMSTFKFVVLEVFGGVAYGRQLTLVDVEALDEWYPEYYSVEDLENTVRWELQ